MALGRLGDALEKRIFGLTHGLIEACYLSFALLKESDHVFLMDK
jgi:hypothetical protein